MDMEHRFRGIFPENIRTIGLMSPSSPPNEKEIHEGIRLLEDAGIKVKVGDHIFAAEVPGQPSAPLEGRLADFRKLWNDPEVDMMVFTRGGEGMIQVVQALDWAHEMPSRPEMWLSGFSDITIMLCALQSHHICHPFAAPNLGSMVRADMETLVWLGDILHGRTPAPFPLEPLVQGDCEGVIMAGHMERLNRISATEFRPETAGRILFIECVSKTVTQLCSYMDGLLQKGFFVGAKGVVFCEFTDCTPDAEIPAMLEHYAPLLGCPVYKGFMFGHERRNLALDLLRRASIRDGVLTML